MSLLVAKVEERCNHKLELTQFDAENRVRAAEARAQHVEAEAKAAVARAEALAREAERKADLRIQQSLDEVEVVEARALRDRQAAMAAKQRADAMVEEERAANAVKVSKLERQVEDIQKQSDLRVAALNQKLEAERRRAEEVERDCKDRVAKIQADTSARIKEVEARVPQTIESARSQCKAQVSDFADQANRTRNETQMRLVEAQKMAQERVELQTKHSSEARSLAARMMKDCEEHSTQANQVCLEREATAKIIEERALARAAQKIATNEEKCQQQFALAQQQMQDAESTCQEAQGLVRTAAADCWRQGIPVAAHTLLSKGNLISPAATKVSKPIRPKYDAENAPTEGTPSVFPHKSF